MTVFIRIIMFFTVTTLILGITLFLLQDQVLLAIGDFLVIQDELHKADVIHVIAGHEGRAEYAIQLYKQGYGKRILFTEAGLRSDHKVNHAEVGRNLALQLGVPSEAIVMDDAYITSTYSETIRLKEYINQSPEPITSVIGVSDPHHMRRVRWTYQKILGDSINIQMAPAPFELTPFQQRWWTDRKTRRMVRNEYLKIAYYYARYQYSWGPLREWLASLDQECSEPDLSVLH